LTDSTGLSPVSTATDAEEWSPNIDTLPEHGRCATTPKEALFLRVNGESAAPDS
jgi:hypothetical protein